MVDQPAGRVHVGAYSGHRYPERPVWVDLEGRRVNVAEVEYQWCEEDRLGFRVKLNDATRLLLYYDPNEDRWDGVVQE